MLLLAAVGVLLQVPTAQAGVGDATGTPAINGTAQVDETLTPDTSGISDADGLTNPDYSYQWMRDDTDIAAETAQTYDLTDGVGKTLRCG